ncbi:acid phosphatase [Lysobacter ciconiae]|uniref:Acid phosphatase n=1 Tax=Novilysobacter ciconiae TaxID=2781022 RepID=A0A7S6ZS47_9GAMM|nr:HAD family acid phosphatase [Lysobacter ciconiae]QOW19385.1 acid phosphatase [Lysobacter ciconiae]
MRQYVSASPLLATLLLLAGCQHTAAVPDREPVGSPSSASSAAPAADDNLHAVTWMQTSAEYRANAMQTYRAALAQLDAALADPQWDALVPADRVVPATGLKPAVVVDIDETVLDNSPYQVRLIRSGLAYDDATWAQWVAEQSARPVPGAVEFAQAADARGITVIYLSNRTLDQRTASLANLRAVGFPVADESVYLGKGMPVEGCQQASGSEKHCRRQWVSRHYRVLMQFGDQLGDFVQPRPNTPQKRAELLEQYGQWFGERWWMLANPSYGDWQPALFENDWSLPPAAQRAAKQRALDARD